VLARGRREEVAARLRDWRLRTAGRGPPAVPRAASQHLLSFGFGQPSALTDSRCSPISSTTSSTSSASCS
jgi:hypothetical protein